MSSLAWIDFDEAERQRSQRIMALFEEKESRDELGLGSIRDSVADHLFPGTSTIQTRLRYMLFIPWLFSLLESSNSPESQLSAEARKLEIMLADALRTGGEIKGLIGRDAGASLRRLPSAVYWAGLGSWGIRKFHGSIEGLFSALRSRGRSRIPIGANEDASASPKAPFWSQSLPPLPDKLLEKTVFQLTLDEVQFLLDRLVESEPNALLTWLAQEGHAGECDYIWDHPHVSEFPTRARQIVQHAAIFSQVMHGASLLYNLALSELRNKEDWVQQYRAKLEAWSEDCDAVAVEAWSLDEFWTIIEHPAHRVSSQAARFVIEWRELLIEGSAFDSSQARDLVKRREIQLKGSHSRYTNQAVRDRWGGQSGIERLGFRWDKARTFLGEMRDAKSVHP